MSIRGLLAGVLLLTGLEVVVSSSQAATRFGGLLSSVGRGVQYFLDPTIPAIPDRGQTYVHTPGGYTPAPSPNQAGFTRHAPTPTVANTVTV